MKEFHDVYFSLAKQIIFRTSVLVHAFSSEKLIIFDITLENDTLASDSDIMQRW